jgi:hypothetical protein
MNNKEVRKFDLKSAHIYKQTSNMNSIELRLISKLVVRYNLILYNYINLMILSAPIVGLYIMVYINMLYLHRGISWS